MKGEIESKKGKVNVEEKATQRGELADTTWSVGKKHTKLLSERLPEVDFPVKNFRRYQ